LKKFSFIALLLVTASSLSAQKGKDKNVPKNPNPVGDAVTSDEKNVNDYLVKKFGYPDKVEYYELKDAMAHPDEVTSLKLHNLELTEVPKEIASFKNLVELDLSGNKITSVAGKLSGLAKLQILNLNANQLTEIPSDLGSLKELHVLNLSANKISGGSISNDKLERLYLNNNELTSLPSGITSNKGLKTLYLHCNSLTSLDEGLLKLNNLEALMVQLNKIAIEPEAFSHYNGIIVYKFYPQAVNKNYLYKAFGGGSGLASARSSIGASEGSSEQSLDENAAAAGSTFTYGGDKVEDYQYGIKTTDAGNGFRRVKIGNHEYNRRSKFSIYFFGIGPIRWIASRSYRNNYRLSYIYYKQERLEKIIAKGPTRMRIKLVDQRNKEIVSVYRRYLKDNKIKAQ
jgi:hypothetical protein